MSSPRQVLLHSAIYGKPAIVSPGGAMEDAVRRYQFGEVVQLNDTAVFACAISKTANLTAEERVQLASRARKYGEVMDARRFMSQFL